MKITIESTEKIVFIRNESSPLLGEIPARIWEGTTENGINVHVYITRIAVDKNEPRIEEFTKDLQEHAPMTPAIQSIPLRLIL